NACDKNFFFFSSRGRHTRFSRDWSSDVCSSDLAVVRVTFSGEVDPASVTTGSVTLTGPAGPVAGRIGFARGAGASSVVTFTPSTDRKSVVEGTKVGLWRRPSIQRNADRLHWRCD